MEFLNPSSFQATRLATVRTAVVLLAVSFLVVLESPFLFSNRLALTVWSFEGQAWSQALTSCQS